MLPTTHNKGPTQSGPQVKERRTATRHFLACEDLCMACCDIQKFICCSTTFSDSYKGATAF